MKKLFVVVFVVVVAMAYSVVAQQASDTVAPTETVIATGDAVVASEAVAPKPVVSTYAVLMQGMIDGKVPVATETLREEFNKIIKK